MELPSWDMNLLAQLAKEYHTPLYVYDMARIAQHFRAFTQAFRARKSLICYALKANANLSILRLLARLGSGADCVSIYEVRRALLAGIPRYKIIFSGVGKSDSEIAEALESHILFINVESEAELLRIESIAKHTSTHTPLKARISIRVNPNIDAKTHPYISTGLEENKFGISIENAKALYLYAHKSPYLHPIGIHFHIGSQLTELAPIAQAAHKIASLARSLLALNMPIKFFDIGGGLGICYEDEKPISLYAYAQEILRALQGCDMTIICEPGRRIIGECGMLLTRVLYEKHTDTKRFVIVDAGLNDLMRPALYGAFHRPLLLQNHAKDASYADIVGPVCESSDVFCKHILLPSLASGDMLAFSNAGAYGYSMASNYNARMRPAEVGIYGQEARLLRAREDFDTSIASELSLLHNPPKSIYT